MYIKSGTVMVLSALALLCAPSEGMAQRWNDPNQGQVIRVPATSRWIDTGIDVREGEMVRFRAEGEVRLSRDADDVARPAGSVRGRQAGRSEFPSQLAGALIGRIDNSETFGIGDQTQALRMPATGRLYLGINDGRLSDNSGEFTVRVDAEANNRANNRADNRADNRWRRDERGQASTIRVPATRRWTDTGIDVREGDMVRFTAEGEVRLSPDATNVASPAGSVQGREAERGGPVARVAGALIGRIGNGETFGIGDQTQALRMPATGRLYLGVNDGRLNDNSGEFTVRVDPNAGNDNPRADNRWRRDDSREAPVVRVSAQRRWTDTSIDVQAGEMVRFTAEGEVRLSPAGDDVSQPAGSVQGRYADRAPFPSQLAGALIGRVGDGAVFGIGNQTQALRMPGSGRLYLGINDDHLNDNAGEYTVRIDPGSDDDRTRRPIRRQ